MQAETLDAVADRGYFNGEEILACDEGRHHGDAAQADDLGREMRKAALASRTLSTCRRGCLPLSGRRAGCTYRYTNEEDGKTLRRYWTTACPELRRSSRNARRARSDASRDGSTSMCSRPCSERLDRDPDAMRQRRETVEHPFGTIKARMGATHFLMKTLPKVATEMALHVLAYNLTRVMNIVGIKPLIAAIGA